DTSGSTAGPTSPWSSAPSSSTTTPRTSGRAAVSPGSPTRPPRPQKWRPRRGRRWWRSARGSPLSGRPWSTSDTLEGPVFRVVPHLQIGRSLSEHSSASTTETTEAMSAHDIQAKRQKYWAENDTFLARGADDNRPRKHVLAMFPYPSGDLHMGHAENYLYSDVMARFWRHRGHNVLNPIGWDSFGLPAENAAIRRGADPREWTYKNIDQQKAAFKSYGVSFDWSRVLHTSDPEYYRWNQWLFLKMYERGLAYRKKSPVNWCPNDQ